MHKFNSNIVIVTPHQAIGKPGGFISPLLICELNFIPQDIK
jgi:hypothetical protein